MSERPVLCQQQMLKMRGKAIDQRRDLVAAGDREAAPGQDIISEYRQ
jgi:hypothetical protein